MSARVTRWMVLCCGGRNSLLPIMLLRLLAARDTLVRRNSPAFGSHFARGRAGWRGAGAGGGGGGSRPGAASGYTCPPSQFLKFSSGCSTWQEGVCECPAS